MTCSAHTRRLADPWPALAAVVDVSRLLRGLPAIVAVELERWMAVGDNTPAVRAAMAAARTHIKGAP